MSAAGTPEAITRWRKRPVEIEARLFDPGADYDEACSVVAWCGGSATDDGCEIGTLEGVMLASPGDWIVKGITGEFYPVKPAIFAATYERADSPVAAALDRPTIDAEVPASDDTGRVPPSSDVKAQGHLWPDPGEPHQPGPKRMVGRRVVCYCRCGKPWPCDRSWQARAEAAEGKLAALDATLPEGAQRPATPELLAALGALWEKFWNRSATLDGDVPGYSLVSYEDVNMLDEAAQAVEALLYPPYPHRADGTEEEEEGDVR